MASVLALLAYGCGGDAMDKLPSSNDVGTGGSGAAAVPYAIVDTAQTFCYGETSAEPCPDTGAAFYGQDAQFLGNPPSYALGAEGLTVFDNVTRLTWQRSPDTNGDGALTTDDKLTHSQAADHCQGLGAEQFGGFDDWRLPSIKELYSLIQFNGTDPSGLVGDDTSALTPFLDTSVFSFAYGDTSANERIIDSQYASSTLYVSTAQELAFGVNFADGRIKGYGLTMPGGGGDKTFFVQCVRGNPSYGINVFVDNGDLTITDQATGLMWSKDDSGAPMDWQAALAWAQSQNAEGFLGYADWRLPNAKELQSILDYSRSPDTTQSAAIDPVFNATAFTNEDGDTDYPWYWASTTHVAFNGMGAGVYVAFGRAGGWQKMQPTSSCYTLVDVHGAGAQRSDPKTTGNLTAIGEACSGGTAHGLGPQGDALRGANRVRLVRNGGTPGELDAGPLPDAPPGPLSCDAQSDCDAAGACPSSLGCDCTQTPTGRACVPRCATSSDCPQPPGMALVCGADGLCVPG